MNQSPKYQQQKTTLEAISLGTLFSAKTHFAAAVRNQRNGTVGLHRAGVGRMKFVLVKHKTVMVLLEKFRKPSISLEPGTVYQTDMSYVMLTSTGDEIVVSCEQIFEVLTEMKL